MMAPTYGHSNAARTMRTRTTSSQTDDREEQQAERGRRRHGRVLLAMYGSSAATIGSSTGRNSVLTPKNAVMVCTKRSGFFASAKATWNHSERHDDAHDELERRELRGAVGMSDTTIAADRDVQPRPRWRAARGDAGKFSGPRAQQDDVDETSEQCAEIRKHNAGPIVHVTRRTAPLMIDTADALTAFAASAARAPALALDTEFMREKTYRAELCLLQIADGDNAVCIDPLAIADLSSLAPLLGAPGVVKIMHAARQDLEVLLPAVGHGAAGVRHADRRRARRTSGAGRLRGARAPPARRGARQGAHARRLVAPAAVRRRAGIRARRRAPPRRAARTAC